MMVSEGERLLLGIGGGIAAYKSVDLVRRLVERGALVRVVMTPAATAFVSPLTYQAVSGHPVRVQLLDPAAEAGMDHIELARWADRLLIAPATADLIARLAAGLADDLLTTLALAATAPLYLAPAMNHRMWEHPATQANVACLRARGARILGPDTGAQACGETGPGRMREPEELARAVLAPLEQPLAGVRALVTSGPTHEPLDPVRFLGNRSSGRMGQALAEALGELGAEATLISGPTALPAPAVAALVRVETALQMHCEVMDRVAGIGPGIDLFVAAAAVADYRPEAPAPAKLKKDETALTLRLVRNPDILAEVAARPDRPFTVGFAAETHDLERNARAKLERKGLDLIAANWVGRPEGGFDHAENALLLLWPGGRLELPMMDKRILGRILAQRIAERFVASRATPPQPDQD